MDKEIAEEIMGTLSHCMDKLNILLVDSKSKLSEEEYYVVKRTVAKVMNTCDFNIGRMIVEQYPELNPFEQNCKSGLPNV